jgi:hypothetical protein
VAEGAGRAPPPLIRGARASGAGGQATGHPLAMPKRTPGVICLIEGQAW